MGYIDIPSSISWSISKDDDIYGIYLYSIWHLMLDIFIFYLAPLDQLDHFVYPNSPQHVLTFLCTLLCTLMLDIFIFYLAPLDQMDHFVYPNSLQHVLTFLCTLLGHQTAMQSNMTSVARTSSLCRNTGILYVFIQTCI